MGNRYVALLRGINVGGKNKLPMKELTAMFTEAGCRETQTYIQSGNVIFAAEPAAVVSLSDVISARILERFGYDVPVIVRNAEQMQAVVDGNPFLAEGAPEETLHVMFLRERPGEEDVRRLNPDRSPPDELRVLGGEVYLRLPNGAGRTKLTTDYIDRTLRTISTARNWRTVTTLAQMMG